MKSIGIIGIGRYLPERVVTNHDIAKKIDTSDEWIVKHIGIRERRVASEEELQFQMGSNAAKEALKSCGLSADDIDMILVTTNVADYPIPPISAMIQKELQASNAGTVDLIGGCSIFPAAIEIARSMLVASNKNYILLIATEKLSTLVDWDDRGLSCFLGDGAAALVLGEVPENYGILSTLTRTIGAYWDKIYMPAGGVAKRPSIETIQNKEHFLKMDGKFVKEMVPKYLEIAVNESIKTANITKEQINWIIPHQANWHLIKYSIESMGLDFDKAIMNIETLGNVSSASVPLAIYDGLKAKKIKKGDYVVTPVFGAGFSYGSCVFRWF